MAHKSCLILSFLPDLAHVRGFLGLADGCRPAAPGGHQEQTGLGRTRTLHRFVLKAWRSSTLGPTRNPSDPDRDEEVPAPQRTLAFLFRNVLLVAPLLCISEAQIHKGMSIVENAQEISDAEAHP